MLQEFLPDIALAPDKQLEAARTVLYEEARAINAIAQRLDKGFCEAVSLLFECEGNVLVTGMGKSGHVGQKIAATFASTGTPAFFLHPAEAVHGDLGRVRESDVVLALSDSGETQEIVRILPSVLDSGAKLIALCSRADSTLARKSQVSIIYGAVQEACPLGLAPTTSSTVMLAVGDALALVVMRMRGFADEDFGRYHPAGSLGRKLQTVDQVMRTGAQMRLSLSHVSVKDVFATTKPEGRRTGAVILVDADGKLEGIFTDGDLARLFAKGDLDAFHRPIREVMTPSPIVLKSGQRVLEALDLLRDRHLSEIPVLDGEGRPIGVVDITDVIELSSRTKGAA